MELLFLVCGVIIGVVLTIVVTRLRRAGTLVVYIPDVEETPYMSLELEHSVGHVSKKKYVTFKVDIRPLNTRR